MRDLHDSQDEMYSTGCKCLPALCAPGQVLRLPRSAKNKTKVHSKLQVRFRSRFPSLFLFYFIVNVTDLGCSRVEMLEKKVEQLMCQIAQVTSGTARDNTIQSNDAPEASHNRENDSPEAMDIISAAHGADPPTVSASERQPSVIDRGLLNQVEAELLVSKFRREFGTKFPFVVLQDNETAAMLAEKQQFLFMCIAAATLSSAHPARRVVCNDIVKQVSLRVLEHSERNLELLQGIMISCAWYSYPSLKGHPQLLLFVQLCVTILHDLGLHAKHDLTADEQRAFLGTYWLSVG